MEHRRTRVTRRRANGRGIKVKKSKIRREMKSNRYRIRIGVSADKRGQRIDGERDAFTNKGDDATPNMVVRGSAPPNRWAPLDTTIRTNRSVSRNVEVVARSKMCFLDKKKMEGRFGKEVSELWDFGTNAASIPLKNPQRGKGQTIGRRRRRKRRRRRG